MKITEKARVNAIELKNIFDCRPRGALPDSSFKLVPEMLARYPGMRGRTQGEKKDNRPPTKATTRPSS